MKRRMGLLFFVVGLVFGQGQSRYGFEEMLPIWQEKYKVPAVGIGVIEEGKIVYTKVFGKQRTDVPANHETIFTVASLTKPVFALVALKLIDKGALKLNEPLYPYHMDPDLPLDGNLKQLNARFVLSHQSGFVNWRNMSPSKKLSFAFTPGSQYLYSGEGYEYLRKAIENKLEGTLPQLASETLFQPLGLSQIAFTWNPDWGMEKVAYPYNREGVEYGYAPRTELNAAAGLQTTIKDYTEVCAYLLNGAGLSETLFAEMMRPQVKVKEDLFYGLGWEVIPRLANQESVLMHSGDESGIKTFVVLFPKSKRGMVVFTNADKGFHVYQKIVESYFAEGNEIFKIKNRKLVPQEKYQIPQEDLDRYTGRFEIKENVSFNIVEADGNLNLIIPGQKSVKLVGQSAQVFLVDEEVKVVFEMNNSGEADTVIIYQYGVRSYEGRHVGRE